MTQGGPAIPVIPVTDRFADGGPALRVAVVSDGRPIEGGPARPVIVVSDGRMTQGNEPVPVVLATGVQSGNVMAGPAIPVVVVSGSLNPTPTYTQKVQALSPIAYWPLAEASGTVIVDESGNGRNGAYKAAGEPLLGQSGIGDGRTAPLFDGTNDYGNLFSASFQGAFNSAEGTLACWCKVSAAGVWTDATERRWVNLRADASNRLYLNKTAINNQVGCTYIAGGTSKGVNFTTSAPLGFFHLALTWSKSADQLKFYVNGAQQGATQTALGTWAGSLAAGNTAAGAGDLVGSNVTSGSLAHVAIWNSALSAAQIATLAVVP